MTAIAIIPTRVDSKRLRGKALKTIQGKSILQHCVDRAKLLHVSDVVVATTDRGCDDPIEGAVDCRVYRGAFNPLERMLACSEGHGAVVRICHDSTIWDQKEVDRHIEKVPAVGDLVQWSDPMPHHHHGVDVWSRRLLQLLVEVGAPPEEPLEALPKVTHQVFLADLPRHLVGEAPLQIDVLGDYVRMCSLYADCWHGGPIPVREAVKWLRSRSA